MVDQSSGENPSNVRKQRGRGAGGQPGPWRRCPGRPAVFRAAGPTGLAQADLALRQTRALRGPSPSSTGRGPAAGAAGHAGVCWWAIGNSAASRPWWPGSPARCFREPGPLPPSHGSDRRPTDQPPPQGGRARFGPSPWPHLRCVADIRASLVVGMSSSVLGTVPARTHHGRRL